MIEKQLQEYREKHKDNAPALLALATLAQSMPSKSAYTKDKTFRVWRRVVEHVYFRNARLQFGLSQQKSKPGWEKISNLLRSNPAFLSKENYHEDTEILLRETDLCSDSLSMVAKSKLSHPEFLTRLDRKVLEFLFGYMPMKLEEAKLNEWHIGSAIHIKGLPGSGLSVEDVKLASNVWTKDFNSLYNENLGFEIWSVAKPLPKLRLPIVLTEDLDFWKIGDILVSLGLCYWCANISAAGNPSIDLLMPFSLISMMLNYAHLYEMPADTRLRLDEVINEPIQPLNKWEPDDFIQEPLSEADIELDLISNPEFLEAGLSWYDSNRPNQFPTGVGRIDLLGRSRNDEFVVIELKKGRVAHEVVGQIQKYLVWVEENLAKGHPVRGIIVAKSVDKGLESAANGSRFPIQIKVFGETPPLSQNVRLCDSCAAPNRQDANYCSNCGNQLWM